MKGVIFNMVREVVEDLFDADSWDGLLGIAELEGAYTALGDYEDEELAAIVAAASAATGQGAEELLRLAGYHGLPKLVALLPDRLKLPADPFSFIRQVNDVVHPGVRKVHQSATPPVFDVTDHPDGLLVEYRSQRNLPSLAEGLLAGVSQLYDVQVNVSRVSTNDESVQFFVTVGD